MFQGRGGGGGLSSSSSGGGGNATSLHSHNRCDRIYGTFTDDHVWAVMTHISYFVSFIAMIPFGCQEILSIFTNPLQWISFGNVVELLSCIIQGFIFGCHLRNSYLNWYYFGTLISTQVILLYIRMLRFVRTLSDRGGLFLDSAFAVVYEVRHWLIYIIITSLCFGFSFSALFKRDRIFAAYSHRDFSSLKHSLVTTFEIVFGNFDSYFILESSIGYLQMLIMIGYQTLIALTVINLLIAAMAEAYISLSQDKEAIFCNRRAGIIVEMEVIKPPPRFRVRHPNYIHFLIIEKDDDECSPKNYCLGNVL